MDGLLVLLALVALAIPVSIIALIVGLMLLWSAIRAFMNASIIAGIIWLLLGLWLLSWIIH